MTEADKGRKRRRRRRWPWVLLALVSFGVFVPWVPYSPVCGDFRTVEGELSNAFRKAMTVELEDNGVPSIEIGGVILLRSNLWGDQYDWVLRAQRLAIESLLYEKYGTDLDAIPEHVEAFRIGELGFNSSNCDLVRAVAIEWETGPQWTAERLPTYTPEARPSEVCVKTPTGWRVPTLKEWKERYPGHIMFDWDKEKFAVCR